MLVVRNASSGAVMSLTREGMFRLYYPLSSVYSSGLTLPQLSISSVVYLGKPAYDLAMRSNPEDLTFAKIADTNGAIVGIVSGAAGGFTMTVPSFYDNSDGHLSISSVWGVGSVVTGTLGSGLRDSLASKIYGTALLLGGSSSVSSNTAGFNVANVTWLGTEALLAYEVSNKALGSEWSKGDSFVNAYELIYWALK